MLRTLPIPDAAAFPVVVRSGRRTVVAAAPSAVVSASGPAALDALERLEPGWWAGFLSYDLGRAVERVVPRLRETGLPDLLLGRYDTRLVVDDDGSTHFEGRPRARARLEHALGGESHANAAPVLGTPVSSLERDAFEAGVRSVIALIEAGECYQVNLTRRVSWDDRPDPVALFRSVCESSPAPHRALVVLPDGQGAPIAVVSASPERFLAWSGNRVETRPIKGTARAADALRASAKDRAENVMIVDLARNDLGRVSEFGSVHVPSLCAVEEHPGLHHLVSTVRGVRRPEVGLGALVRATFPPASVTGAPKPRVLQAIEDLEPVRRGVYCGAVGWIDTERDEGDLAVAIRTFTITGDGTSLGVGGGIVADSEPAAEWDETELKSARLLAAAGIGEPAGLR